MTDLVLSITLIIPMFIVGIMGALSLADARICPDHKRALRVMGFVCAIYFELIYILALSDSTAYALRSGIMTRAGVIILAALYVLEIVSARRKRHPNERARRDDS